MNRKRLLIISALLIPGILLTIYLVKPDPQDMVLGMIQTIEGGHDSALLSKVQNELIRQFIHFGQEQGIRSPYHYEFIPSQAKREGDRYTLEFFYRLLVMTENRESVVETYSGDIVFELVRESGEWTVSKLSYIPIHQGNYSGRWVDVY